MKIDINTWLKTQDIEFKEEIKDLQKYMNKPMTLEELEEFDNSFINNSPAGGETSND